MAASGTAITWMRGEPMHFEILVEDTSEKIALESILEKILGPYGQDHTYKIISYKGIGRIPKNLMGWPHTGQAKCEWAKNIAPHLDVESNQSRSFQVLRDGIRNMAGIVT